MENTSLDGNPHIRIGEGDGASIKPRMSILYKKMMGAMVAAMCFCVTVSAADVTVDFGKYAGKVNPDAFRGVAGGEGAGDDRRVPGGALPRKDAGEVDRLEGDTLRPATSSFLPACRGGCHGLSARLYPPEGRRYALRRRLRGQRRGCGFGTETRRFRQAGGGQNRADRS